MKKKNLLLLLVISYLNADIIDYNNSSSPRDLASNSIVYGHADASLTTSIIGLSLKRLSDASSRLVTGTVSKLVLQDSSITLDGDYSFTYSSLQIVGDVSISGCGNTFKFFGNNILISAGSTLRLSDDITFDYTPSSSSDSAIVLQDCNSTLFLDNATLNIDNGEISGLRLHNGKLKIAGDSTVTLASTFTDNSLFLGGGAEDDCQLEMVNDATLNISNGNIISQNNDATSFKIAKSAMINGNFLFRGVSDSSGSVQAFDLLNNNFNFDLDRLTGVTLPGSITELNSPLTSSLTFSSDLIRDLKWSPNGKFLAIVGEQFNGQGGPEAINVFSFDGDSLVLLDTSDFGSEALAVAWSPDSKFLAVGGDGPASGFAEICVFRFENNSLSLVATKDTGGPFCFDLNWSPDGRLLAVGTSQNPSQGEFVGNEVNILEFSSNSLLLLTSVDITTGSGNSVRNLIWSPDGEYLAVGAVDATGGVFGTNDLGVLKLDGKTLTAITSFDVGSNGVVGGLSWSANGKFLAVGADPGGPLGTNEMGVFRFNGSSLSLVSSIEYGDQTTNDVAWSPDGRFLALGGDDGSTGGIFGVNEVAILEFTGSSLVTSTFTYIDADARLTQWSPDGQFLAVGTGPNPSGVSGEDNLLVFNLNYESTNATDNVKNFKINFDAVSPNNTTVKDL